MTDDSRASNFIGASSSIGSSSLIGIDIGGTFTDFVLIQDGAITVHKRLTTPGDPARALLEGIAHLDLAPNADVIHGSTVATNALLERRGAATALITTEGFADVIEIGRQNRPDLYALVPHKPPPLIPSEWRFEVKERITSEGEVLIPLDDAEIDALVARLRDLPIDSIAVCLLFSFLYPDHEQRIAEALRPHFSISISSEILPEYREYERVSTTAINAYVAPLMDRYLAHVEAGLDKRRLLIMQSNGGVISADTARREAARTALSGPAGGAVGAFHIASMAGFDHIISFDMGGTSTDVSLFPGSIQFTRESQIGGMPLRLPVVDIHTVGAGGGSIARVDAGGALQVGPHSAGADPGPACYGRGDQPTISDANLVLGRLHPDHFLGGEMDIYPDRAREVMQTLAEKMGADSPVQAALGVIRIGDAVMERAIRAISIERGYDVRDFVLVPFGGAGPLHAPALARALGITRILIPRTPGVLSALGMTIADRIKDYSQAVLGGEDMLNQDALGNIIQSLAARGAADLQAEGLPRDAILTETWLDMRYRGQSHEITVPEPADGDWSSAFHAAHAARYGYQHEGGQVEIVTARVRAIGKGPGPRFEPLPDSDPDPASALINEYPVSFSTGSPVMTSFYVRDALSAGQQIPGPAVIVQLDTTILIPPNWTARVDRWGNLLVT